MGSEVPPAVGDTPDSCCQRFRPIAAVRPVVRSRSAEAESSHSIRHARFLYLDGGCADIHARWIAEHILVHCKQKITDRDIDRAYRALRGSDRRSARIGAMAELEAEGWVKAGRSHRDGQVREWSVNPLVHDGRFKQIALHQNEWRTGVREAIAEEGQRRKAEAASGGGQAA